MLALRLERQALLTAIAPQHHMIDLDPAQNTATGQAFTLCIETRGLPVAQQGLRGPLTRDKTGAPLQGLGTRDPIVLSRETKDRSNGLGLERLWYRRGRCIKWRELKLHLYRPEYLLLPRQVAAINQGNYQHCPPGEKFIKHSH